MKLRSFFIIIPFVVLLIVVGLIIQKSSVEPSSATEPLDTRVSYQSARGGRVSSIREEKVEEFRLPRYTPTLGELANDPSDMSNLNEHAQQLEDPHLSEKDAVYALHKLLLSLSRYTNGGYLPSAENVELANALLGQNKKKVAYMHSSSIRLNDHGELIDQWGTPYSFHMESMRTTTIRSAGPDCMHYTQDDIVSE